jgi:hypothetical protein
MRWREEIAVEQLSARKFNLLQVILFIFIARCRHLAGGSDSVWVAGDS